MLYFEAYEQAAWFYQFDLEKLSIWWNLMSFENSKCPLPSVWEFYQKMSCMDEKNDCCVLPHSTSFLRDVPTLVWITLVYDVAIFIKQF